MAAEDVTAEIHGFSEPDSTPTPWAAGLEQLRAADTFWLSTVRPDGRPHVTPLIAVWHAGALWFATGPEERKARNLAENPWCVLTTGRSDLVEGALDVVLEGRAEQVTNEPSSSRSRACGQVPDRSWDSRAHRALGDRLGAEARPGGAAGPTAAVSGGRRPQSVSAGRRLWLGRRRPHSIANRRYATARLQAMVWRDARFPHTAPLFPIPR